MRRRILGLDKSAVKLPVIEPREQTRKIVEMFRGIQYGSFLRMLLFMSDSRTWSVAFTKLIPIRQSTFRLWDLCGELCDAVVFAKVRLPWV
jgi:hypothetical protein